MQHNKSMIIKMAEALSKKVKKTTVEIGTLEVLKKFVVVEVHIALSNRKSKSKRDDKDDEDDHDGNKETFKE